MKIETEAEYQKQFWRYDKMLQDGEHFDDPALRSQMCELESALQEYERRRWGQRPWWMRAADWLQKRLYG